MALPYHSGQAQEDLPDRLVPASVYGLKVVRLGYLLVSDRPATLTQALAACDSSKGYADHISDTDVNKHAHLAGYGGQGHQGRDLFVCPQPECTVAGVHFFASLPLWNSGWHTGTLSMWPLPQCSIAWCVGVTLKQLPRHTHWMRYSVTSLTPIQASMLMANDLI